MSGDGASMSCSWLRTSVSADESGIVGVRIRFLMPTVSTTLAEAGILEEGDDFVSIRGLLHSQYGHEIDQFKSPGREAVACCFPVAR